METFNHVVISMVTKIQLGTKHGIYDCMIRKWSLVIFVLIINVKFWCSVKTFTLRTYPPPIIFFFELHGDSQDHLIIRDYVLM